MARRKKLKLRPIGSLESFGSGELVALNVGWDQQIYGVVALNETDYRSTEPSGFSFAKVKPETAQHYCVQTMYEGEITQEVDVPAEPYNIHAVQPLPNDELLLVCCRSQYRGPNDIDQNGRVYSANGEFLRDMVLGDGIQDVQATSTGEIWTSFFDEGVLGNYGWREPLGASGLVGRDSNGTKFYEYQPIDGLDTMCDCYALNVESESSVWLYYYTEFPLVHLRDRKVAAHWAVPVKGSHAFAIGRGFALFSGGYDDRDDFHLFQLNPNGKAREVVRFRLANERGKRIQATGILARGEALYVAHGDEIFRCTVQMAINL